MERMEATGALGRIADSLPRLLDRLDVIERMLQGVETAAAEADKAPAAGGLGGLWGLVRDPESQRTLRFLLGLGREIRASQRR